MSMSDLRVRNIDEDEIDTVIGEDVIFTGELDFDRLVLVKGELNGTIRSVSDIFLGPGGKVDADIQAEIVSVKGQLLGNIKARRRLELFSTCTVKGNIETPDMIMQSGARFNGSCRMDTDFTTADKEV